MQVIPTDKPHQKPAKGRFFSYRVNYTAEGRNAAKRKIISK